MHTRKVVVLGSNGFIGGNVAQFIERSAIARVVRLDLPVCDLTDTRSIELLSRELDASTTLIVAAGIKREVSDSQSIFFKNLQMIFGVCEAVRLSSVEKIIYFSSASVYGEENENLCITERSVISPTSNYGVWKCASELMLQRLKLEGRANVVTVLRPVHIYGAKNTTSPYGPDGFLAAATHAKEIVLWGDGRELREFVFIGDVVRVTLRMVEIDFDGTLNLAFGESSSFFDIVSILREFLGDIKVSSRPRTKRLVHNVFDASLLRSILPPGFQHTRLQEGIRQLIRNSE